MKKILFLIHDLGQGGAEKVLVNLVNHLDRSKFDISVVALFGGGVNEQFLAPDIHFRTVFPKEIPGNSKLMRLLTPKQLHQLCVKEHYDIEVSYLEGPSARVISGCADSDTKTVCWIHSTFSSLESSAVSFRSIKEAEQCYRAFDEIICVAQGVRKAFIKTFPACRSVSVLYNVTNSSFIISQAKRSIAPHTFHTGEISLIGIGSMKKVKAFDRLIRIHAKLRGENYPIHTYLLGRGPDLNELKTLATECNVSDTISFLGYDVNPYKYLAHSNLFVCSSISEGFSTATTEALILGVPVCTVEVSGMREMLGDSEYGLITDNSEEALYRGIKSLLDSPEMLLYYKKQAQIRGKSFSTKETVKAVEEMLLKV